MDKARLLLKKVEYVDVTFMRIPIADFSKDELCKIIALIEARRRKELDEILGVIKDERS